jgi:hypothetical protein
MKVDAESFLQGAGRCALVGLLLGHGTRGRVMRRWGQERMLVGTVRGVEWVDWSGDRPTRYTCVVPVEMRGGL